MAAAVKPKHETIIDQYFAQNMGKISNGQLVQNAITSARLAYGLFSPEWKAFESQVNAYAMAKAAANGLMPKNGPSLDLNNLMARLISGQGSFQAAQGALDDAKAAADAKTKETCAKCDKVGKMQLCGRCGSASYCSRECQVADWKAHKSVCQLLVAANAASAAAK